MSSASETKAAAAVHKERLSFIEAAVFENEVGSEGKTRFKVVLSKSYKDSDGSWQRTGSLDPEDIPYAVKVLDRSHTWIAEERYKRAKASA